VRALRRPLVVVVVSCSAENLPVAQFGTVAVRKGDDPMVLAKNFVQTFSLKKSLVPDIAQQIKEQILAYFVDRSLLPEGQQHKGTSSMLGRFSLLS